MARYLLGRLVAAVPTLALLTLAAFLLNLAVKGDPTPLALQADRSRHRRPEPTTGNGSV